MGNPLAELPMKGACGQRASRRSSLSARSLSTCPSASIRDGHASSNSGTKQLCPWLTAQLASDASCNAAALLSGQIDANASARAMSSALRSEEHTSELQSRENLVCRLLLEK